MQVANAQISATFTTKINTVCNGNPCIYNGPKILINEVMLSPLSGDGSIFGYDSLRRAEWIELYNPDICQSIDISCFFLGNNAPELTQTASVNYGGGFVIPTGTIVPPRGFVVIRGSNAAPVPSYLLLQNGGKTIEIVVDENIINNICLDGGQRLWFPNLGGWFAFYDDSGIPQDAISWNDETKSCMTCPPCNPIAPSCGYNGYLTSYHSIPVANKNYITSVNPADYQGLSLRRIPDGGNWNSNPSAPTYGNCNTICIPPPNITCNGMAVVIPSGGQAPYAFLWDDQQLTTNDTVSGLCEGVYHVIIADANNDTVVFSVQINNLQLTTSISSTNVSCMGGNNGSVTAIPNNGTSPFHYLWNTGDTLSSINNLGAGNYSVAITDKNGCVCDSFITIPESTVILTVNTNNETICKGYSTTLTASPSIVGGIFHWMPNGQQTSDITVTPLFTTNYSVIYTISGCIAKDTSTVTVNSQPHASIYCSKQTISPDDSTELQAMGAISFLWNNGLTSDKIFVYPDEDTIYCVIASNNNGCFDSTCIKINVRGVSMLYVPNAFTPNYNGLNDVFLVKSTNIEKFHIVIFNRWGNLLFETNDINVGWDGKYNGILVPEGVYVYSIEAIGEDKVPYRKLGSLTVLR